MMLTRTKVLLFIVLQLCFFSTYSQEVYKITYNYYQNDKLSDQDPIIVFADKNKSFVTKQSVLDGSVKYPYEVSFWDNSSRVLKKRAHFSANHSVIFQDTSRWNANKFECILDTNQILGYKTFKGRTSINSNTIEVWYTNDIPIYVSANDIGNSLGLVLDYRRNGSSGLKATRIEKLKSWPAKVNFLNSSDKIVDVLTYNDLLWKSRFIQIPIFTDEQICFQPGIKSDSIMRFAEGTVIVKKVKIPKVNSDSQAFIELIEKSNGDAYDRTGSVFLIAEDNKVSFLDGMMKGMNTLPKYDVGDGKSYLGMVRTSEYTPVFELMRFFTPFGINHFNDRLTLKDKTWQDSSMYRQDISEFLNVLSGKEVYIGVYIGNYDKGGHKVSLELTLHSGSSNYAREASILSLFNTTNIMEMGGQTYATLFGHEKGLEFEFELDKDIENVKLRYITTGHGGWGNGDEFVPKVNSIFIDDELIHEFVPWRVDCASYRLYNPVSGNFSNGLSSSDLSRSNWCPGTITSPNYINLKNMKAGKHKIRVQIPQGKAEYGSFSFWNVSGALIFDKHE